MHYIRREYYILTLGYSRNKKGKDRRYKSNPEHKCSYCNNLPASEWLMKASHTTRTCAHLKSGEQHSRGAYMPNYMLNTGQGGVVRVCVDTWRNVWGFSCRLMEKFGAVTLS